MEITPGFGLNRYCFFVGLVVEKMASTSIGSAGVYVYVYAYVSSAAVYVHVYVHVFVSACLCHAHAHRLLLRTH